MPSQRLLAVNLSLFSSEILQTTAHEPSFWQKVASINARGIQRHEGANAKINGTKEYNPMPITKRVLRL